MYKYAILTFLILTSCSKENLEFNVPTTSEVEKLIKHSDEFNQEVITFDTPGMYLYQCTPHASMGMIALVIVDGDTSNKDAIAKTKIRGKSKKLLKKLLADL